MAEPKSIKLGVGGEGILIEYIKSRNVLCVSGWYDGVVGIGGWEIPIKEFFDRLGIKGLGNNKLPKQKKGRVK